MTFSQTTPLWNGLGLIHGADETRPKSAKNQQGQQSLRATRSLANLIHFARHPVENVGEAVENWYDGSTKEERARRQVLADRKQLLYLKLRTVSLPVHVVGTITDGNACRPLPMRTGMQQQKTLMTSKATMSGS